MLGMKAEELQVVPASETVNSETRTPQGQDCAKNDNPPIKPATGRLPARASRRGFQGSEDFLG